MNAPDAPRPPVPAAYVEPEDEAHRFIVAIAKCVNYREIWKLQRKGYHEVVHIDRRIPLDDKRVSVQLATLMAARREYDGARMALRSFLPHLDTWCSCGSHCTGEC